MADKVPAAYNLIFNRIAPHITSALSLLPSGVVLGSGALSLLTFNQTLIITTLFFVELLVIHGISSSFLTKQFPTLLSATATATATATNQPLFFIAATLSYLNGALIAFSDVFDRIGGEYPSKSGTALVMSFLILAALISYYVTTSQTSFGYALLTVFVAIIAGALLLQLHSIIFGQESINVLGVPLVVSRTGTGKPLYACGVVPK